MSLNDTIKKYSVQIKSEHSEGSGVIVKLDNEDIDYFYILTAKHTFFKEEAVDEEALENMDEKLINKEKIKILDFEDKVICEEGNENILDVIGIDKKYDFLLLKIHTYHGLVKLNALSVFKDTFKSCVICGYPDIKSNDDNKILPILCEYVIKSEKNKSYELKAIDTMLTKFAEDLSAVDEMVGLSGSGVFFGENHDELSLVGIQVKAPSLQLLQCLDLREIIGKINTKLINKKCVPIQVSSTDGIKANEVDTTLKEYHLTIECIPKNEKFQITIFTNNDNRMKDTYNEKSYTKDEIARLIDKFVKENKPSHIDKGDVFLLFVLPIALMSEHIGNWKIEENRLLGDKYTIMLRAQERYRSKNRHLYAPLGDWKNDWKNCFDKRFEPIKNVMYEKSRKDGDRINYQKMKKYPLMIFSYNLNVDMFKKLYDAGVSKAMWVGVDAKSKKFRKLFKKEAYNQIKLGELHNNLCDFRDKEEKIGSHIMFLYDNPNELPLDDSDMAQINPIL